VTRVTRERDAYHWLDWGSVRNWFSKQKGLVRRREKWSAPLESSRAEKGV